MFSHELISIIIKKKKLHKIWLEFNVLADFIEFKKSRVQCIRLSRVDRQKSIENIDMSSTKNVKKFWNYVNELCNNAGIPEEVFF